jgi:hypothetical protein
MRWGERFNDAGTCQRHNEPGCPSCLANALGDLQATSDAQRRDLQGRNTELVEENRRLRAVLKKYEPSAT